MSKKFARVKVYGLTTVRSKVMLLKSEKMLSVVGVHHATATAAI